MVENKHKKIQFKLGFFALKIYKCLVKGFPCIQYIFPSFETIFIANFCFISVKLKFEKNIGRKPRNKKPEVRLKSFLKIGYFVPFWKSAVLSRFEIGCFVPHSQ